MSEDKEEPQIPKKIVPPEITMKLAAWAKDNEYGFAQIASQDMTLLVLGDKNLSPDQIAIIAAHALLLGVLEGGFMDLNRMQRMMEDQQNKGRPN